MKSIVSLSCAALVALSLSGCAVNEAQRQQDSQVSASRIVIEEAQKQNAVTCPTAEKCQKSWQLAKAYAQKHSDMRFQFSDDTTASTYAPVDYEQVGISVTKTPQVGSASRIEITAVCKGANSDVAKWVIKCADRLNTIYMGFGPFVEAKL